MSFLRRFLHRPASPARMAAARTKAQGLIDGHGAVVFSKSYCPHCRATKQLLSELGAKYELVELDQDALEEISSQRTVPNVFINHKHIGGNSELQAKKKELPGLLQEAHAI